jgi:hypothetical protein
MIQRVRSFYLTHVVLPRMVKANRESFATRDFVKRRQAALKHTRGRLGHTALETRA